MESNSNFFENLRKKLTETTKFPSKYLFKFIIPADDEKFKKIEDVFNYGGAVITTKASRTGKFTSVSVLIEMNSVDEVIAKYEEVAKIEGVISL